MGMVRVDFCSSNNNNPRFSIPIIRLRPLMDGIHRAWWIRVVDPRAVVPSSNPLKWAVMSIPNSRAVRHRPRRGPMSKPHPCTWAAVVVPVGIHRPCLHWHLWDPSKRLFPIQRRPLPQAQVVLVVVLPCPLQLAPSRPHPRVPHLLPKILTWIPHHPPLRPRQRRRCVVC